jgi:hypothetical protein
MGKFVILPSHPSNDFLAQFPNCLAYANRQEFVGNLYYALTHSPQPLAEEYARALSWEAATERLIAAACIPVEEHRQLQEAISRNETGIEIALAPSTTTTLMMIDNNNNNHDNEKPAAIARLTKLRFKQFRTRLLREIVKNRVLPKPLREQMIYEIKEKLKDVDFDELFESPKLRVMLSPAELDKSLLELYESISKTPGGDLLRVIGGGGSIGLQNIYMKRQARKQQSPPIRKNSTEILESIANDLLLDDDDDELSTAERIRRVLRRYAPDSQLTSSSIINDDISIQQQTWSKSRLPSTSNTKKTSRYGSPRMCHCDRIAAHDLSPATWTGLRPPTKILVPGPSRLSRSCSFKLLI